MLTEEIAIKLILQELGVSPNTIKPVGVEGCLTTYFVDMGSYLVGIKDLNDGSYRLTIMRNGQRIDTYHDAQTLEEDEGRTQIERRTRYLQFVRNTILKHGVDWCKRVYDDWETLLQVELDDAMGLGLYPDPSEDSDCT